MPEIRDPSLIAVLERPQSAIDELDKAGVGTADFDAIRQEAIAKIKLGRSLIERSKKGWFTTGPGTGLAAAIGYSPAGDVRADVETLKSAGALTRIIDMAKQNGGKNPLTPLSNADLEALGKSIANIDASQSDEQFQRNVQTYLDLYQRAYEGAGGKNLDRELTGQDAPPVAAGRGAVVSPDGSGNFPTDRDKQFAAAAQKAFDEGADKAALDALAVSWGYGPFGADLDAAIDYRDKGGRGARAGVPESGFQGPSLIGAAAGSDAGAYFTGAANALTAGRLDEIVGLAGGDADRAQQAKEIMRANSPLASAAGELTGGALAMTGIGRVPGLAGRALLADTAYGVAYGSGENNDNRLGGAVTGGAASAAGSYFGGKLLDRLGQGASVARDRIGRAREFGIDLPMDAAGGRTSTIIGRGLDNFPGSASVMEAGREVTRNQVSDAVEGVADTFGAANSFRAIGEAAQRGAKTWISRFEATADKLYQSIPISSKAPTTLGNTQATLQQLNSRYASNPQLAATMQNSRLQAYMNALGGKNGSLSWEDLKTFRSQIGEEIGDARFSDGTKTSDLRALYASLSEDMRSSAAAQGPAALRAFERANTFYREGQQRIDNALQSILGDAKNLNPEAAAATIQSIAKAGKRSSDLKKLADVRASMKPAEWGEVAGGMIRLLGQPANSAGREFDPGVFVRNYRDMAPEARNLLFSGEDKVLRQNLDQFVSVMDDLARSNSLRNNSNSVPGINVGGLIGGTGTAASAVVAGASPLYLFGVPATIGAAWGMSRAWTNPRFVQWATGYARMMKGAQRSGGAPNVQKQAGLLRKVAAAEPAIAAEANGLAQMLSQAANDNAVRAAASEGNKEGQEQN